MTVLYPSKEMTSVKPLISFSPLNDDLRVFAVL